ncbi:MAG: GumC family protein [Geobacteraceae bacterium]
MAENLEVGTTAELYTSNSLVSYLQVVSRRSKQIMLITFLAALISAGITLCIPNIYTAKSMILPPQEDRSTANALLSQFGGLIGMAGGVSGTQTAGELYVTMLTSDTVKDPIVNRFKLMEAFGAKYRSDAYRALAGATSVALGRKDGVITVSVSDKNPKRAAEIANAYVDELGQLTASLSVSGAERNRAFLESRLAESKASLISAEEALKTFQLKNKTIEVPHQAEATIRGVADMNAALVMKEVELSTSLRTFTESSQRIKNLRAAIANLKSQIRNYESGTGGGAIPSLGSVPQLGQDYVRLMREFKTQEALVELLTKQYEMTKLNEAKDYSQFQVIQVAKTPERKNGPQRLKIVVLVTVSTFLFMLFYVFVQDYWTRMTDTEKSQWREVRDQWRIFNLRR